MLVNFTVQNFGSIKDKQTLSFEADKSSHLEDYYVIPTLSQKRLLKMALIYGANASGKTTILKALDFLFHIGRKPKEKKTDTFDFQPFLFDENTAHENTLFTVEFIQNEVLYEYEIELNQQAIIREELYYHQPKKALVFKRSTDLENQFSKITLGSKIKVDSIFIKTLEANTLWNNSVVGGFQKTNIQFKELKDVTDWFKVGLYITPETGIDTLSSLILNENTYKHALTHLLKTADFNISDVRVKGKNEPEMEMILELNFEKDEDKMKQWVDSIPKPSELIFEHTIGTQKHPLPFKQESQGTQRYYGLAGLLVLMLRGSLVVAVDELESSLHPDLYLHFLLSFLVNNKHSQLIATTHNREILNNRDLFRNDAIWITDKDDSSATELYSLSDFDTNTIRDTSNIYNAYKQGKLGGVPNLGDYYINFEETNQEEEKHHTGTPR